MALGLGDGGEQNAPLGRAVIGGLLLATFGTLTFVPVFFSLMHRNDPRVGPAQTEDTNGGPGMRHRTWMRSMELARSSRTERQR